MINYTDVKFEGHLIRQYATGKALCSILQNCLLFHYAKSDMRKGLSIGGKYEQIGTDIYPERKSGSEQT